VHKVPPVADFKVTKEYCEDLGEKDADGYYDYEYRYWDITFDFGDRSYFARIYTDRTDEASVSGPLRTADEKSRGDLEAMARYLVEVEAVKRVLTLSDPSGKLPTNRKGGYRPVDLGFLGRTKKWTLRTRWTSSFLRDLLRAYSSILRDRLRLRRTD
jgi:hypothetical protein